MMRYVNEVDLQSSESEKEQNLESNSKLALLSEQMKYSETQWGLLLLAIIEVNHNTKI